MSAAAVEVCPECGAPGLGGRAGCQARLEEISLQARSDPRRAALFPLGFDAYCMQHIDLYCVSAKSYAAHLTRLACGLEYGGEPGLYTAIARWLDGARAIDKPPILTARGRLTVADLPLDPTISADAFAEAVHAWAEAVWAAYAEQHSLARAWILAARNHPRRPNPSARKAR